MTDREAIKRALEGFEQGYPIEALMFLDRWVDRAEQDEAVERYFTWDPDQARAMPI